MASHPASLPVGRGFPLSESKWPNQATKLSVSAGGRPEPWYEARPPWACRLPYEMNSTELI
jgi:hypothetical protein